MKGLDGFFTHIPLQNVTIYAVSILPLVVLILLLLLIINFPVELMMTKFSLFLAALMTVSGAHAATIDVGAMMGGANVFAVRDFISHASDAGGAIVAGRNVNISQYSVNEQNRAAYRSYSIAAGGNITLNQGSIHHGKTYAGGTITFDDAAAPPDFTRKPTDFAASSRRFYDLAKDLSNIPATGTVDGWRDGVMVRGNGNGVVDVFDVASDAFRDAAGWNLEALTPGQTLIFNISGERGTFRSGTMDFAPLAAYNVLFNFYEAREVDVRGVIGTVLAPFAAMEAGAGVVKGHVVVDTWNSPVKVGAAHYFKPVELAGLRAVGASRVPAAELPAADAPDKNMLVMELPVEDMMISSIPAADISASSVDLAGVGMPIPNTFTARLSNDVPEPGTLALMAVGVGVLAWRCLRQPRWQRRDAFRPARASAPDGAPA